MPEPPSATAPTAPPEATTAPPPLDLEAPADTATEEESSEVDQISGPPTWLLPGLTGAGTVLAGSLFLALRAQRRTQLRSEERRVGNASVRTCRSSWSTGHYKKK